MTARSIIMAAAGAVGVDKTYVDDVFSTYLYTGSGATRTITNGIDLATHGGLVWFKNRSAAYNHVLFDTARGVQQRLETNLTDAQVTQANGLTAFNSNGFTIGDISWANGSPDNIVSWTFRKAPKFFDCGTYTGNGVAGRQIPHSLGVAPGMVIVKCTNASSNWIIYHRSITAANSLWFTTDAQAAYGDIYWNNTEPTTSNFTVGANGGVNASGSSYVWYAFAHDTGTDGIIQCGSFTTDGSGNATVTLGWEPQFIITKAVNTASNWRTSDTLRGWTGTPTIDNKILYMDTSSAEASSTVYHGSVTSTGFNPKMDASTTFIYLAIRRPNKPPTSGTQVYNAIARTGTGAAATVTGVGFAPDLLLARSRVNASGFGHKVIDRLRAVTSELYAGSTQADSTGVANTVTSFDMNGMTIGTSNSINNADGQAYINHFFKRAPGVFSICAYTGTGSSTTVAHDLGVAPELIVAKSRTGARNWAVWHHGSGPSNRVRGLSLNTTAVPSLPNNTQEVGTTTTFNPYYLMDSAGSGDAGNWPSETYVAYLFATKAGISKVGSYTGNGSSQTINCGFTTGARFFLCKRTDSPGDWFVWDSVRGIVAGNDPHLSLNTTAAEVTADDSVDPDSSGIIVNQVAATNINVNGATYIFLAIA